MIDDDELVVKALLDVRSYRERCIPMVKDIKSKATPNQIDSAKVTFNDARAEINAWILTLASCIKDKIDLTQSKEFKNKGENVNEKVKDFLRFGESLLNPGEYQTHSQYSGYSFVNLHDFLQFADLIKDLLEIGITVWTTYSQKSQKKRIALSDDLRNECWPEWDEIK
jgi:hypothetical protein